MKRIILNLHEDGQIKDDAGAYVGTDTSLVFKEEGDSEPNIPKETLIMLKNAGFDAKEIIEMFQEGLL